MRIMKDEQDNPWKIHSETIAYDNPWIRVTEYQVTNPSGGPGIYGKVHFKNRAIGILPLDAEGNTWLIGQYRFVLNQYSWEMPEGGGLLDQDPLEAARRELLEEAGLVATEWSELLRLHLSNSVSDEDAIVYLARGLSQHKPQPEATEQLQIRKVPFQELYEFVNNGSITDALTVAAVLKLKLLLLDGTISA